MHEQINNTCNMHEQINNTCNLHEQINNLHEQINNLPETNNSPTQDFFVDASFSACGRLICSPFYNGCRLLDTSLIHDDSLGGYVYMYTWVCILIYIYMYVCIYIYIYNHVHIYVCVYVCMYIYVCSWYAYACVMYALLSIFSTCTHTYIHACISTRIHICNMCTQKRTHTSMHI